ncbi:hypothetical protein HD553DRAFT_340688 [Filobasidium floriforme]|uniref:uncharacterized protein n=1 Tax=Filobasidium floriforme TaxID=5210 RepID=UPI001E8E163A|nr:uncharacterized protein HD553DRAFT_340688 [Filobasidium floriforme]KAH8087513.1 hypothetical protein HD553DRAFT_340688 [Filobasidium floriforme]
MPMKRSASDDELESTPSPKKARAKKPAAGQPFEDSHKASPLPPLRYNLILANRSNLYGLPGLEDVKENGGSRINGKIMVMLKEWEKQNGGQGNYAVEAVKKMKKTK